mmetsp:Transcript_9957/g.24748  ORF Transcript_9957/g.24748 Transcript_9957/m.24748 type:complete len:499 (+) Transcript_9957:72-1568(+)|eukprot:CAMPEP_0118830794 /NCGR_PEP_ID=MMETSP1162-20130426/28111_1 /TAXON_ID=33656 /ORGANISM="Phaeocystis Sp, Strain CCMP2710" /LENGTH=498 /DNA_ID=CAMNT_0006762155 /DNA_START=70 /DNA_END=1566 /DNA_ORIENTATION=+
MAAAEASTADQQQHPASRAARATPSNRSEGEKARPRRGARGGFGRVKREPRTAAPPLGTVLSDALALALQAQHAREKPCSAISGSAGSRTEQGPRTEQHDEPLQGGEALEMGKSAAKAGSAVAAPRTAAAPAASVNSTRHAVDNKNIASLRPATAGGVKGRESGGGESADATTRGSPHTSSREERARSRCASSNEGARRSHFSADLGPALAEATLEIESPMVPPLVQGTSSEPGPGSLSEAGTSWAGLIGATSTAQPRVQLLAAQEADSPAEALRLAGRVDAEQTFGALSFPSRPLPSLSVPQQAHTTDFWHPRKNKARVASSAEGPAALAPARTACPGLPLSQPAVRPLRRTSAQEHWQRGAMAAAPAERAPSLATPRVQSPRRQVEYYFSASNLQKDFFLRRHIEADAHGFVALELLNSFPRMRTFGLTPEQLATRLASSSILEVDAPAGRVRRRPMPSPTAACAVGPGPAPFSYHAFYSAAAPTGLPSQDWRYAA